MNVKNNKCEIIIKYISVLIVIMGLFACSTGVSEEDITGKEPPHQVLGAPLYPDAIFMRTMSSLDPFYETVIYVSPHPVDEVKNFFSQHLPHARVIQYREENAWVWAYLLKDGILIPDKPTRDDLTILDASPNVQVKRFQNFLYEPLIEFLQTQPDSQKKLEALEKAHTVIKYTYEYIAEDIGFTNIIGKWKNVDRDLSEFYGSILQFNPDSTYTLTLTGDNITALTNTLSSDIKFENTSPETIKKSLEDCNPERGIFFIMRNAISMKTEKPVVGDKTKSGLAEVKSYSLSLELINTPRLSFVRLSSE
ncbi:MAG TPA: hypothetical protein VMZ04_10280 [Anaerolineae bacterium]|nr:hypothetical protein [Anaerolineae bacterium]